jgi:hypothetical protein
LFKAKVARVNRSDELVVFPPKGGSSKGPFDVMILLQRRIAAFRGTFIFDLLSEAEYLPKKVDRGNIYILFQTCTSVENAQP